MSTPQLSRAIQFLRTCDLTREKKSEPGEVCQYTAIRRLW